MYDIAKHICHEAGLNWSDPRTGKIYPPPQHKVEFLETKLASEVRDVLYSFGAAHRIAFNAAVAALDAPVDMLMHVLIAIERHFASEINRLYEGKK